MRFFRWLKRVFAPNPQPAPRVDVLPAPQKGSRIALVVGHHAGAKGARMVTGVQEYDYFNDVADMVTDTLNSDKVRKFLRDGRTIAQTINAAADWGADIIIELHFNAFNGTAHGAEILIPHGTSNPLGQKFLEEWCDFAGLRNRGVKTVTRTQPEGTAVFAINNRRKEGFLFEAFFGDNVKDYREVEITAEFFCKWIKERI